MSSIVMPAASKLQEILDRWRRLTDGGLAVADRGMARDATSFPYTLKRNLCLATKRASDLGFRASAQAVVLLRSFAAPVPRRSMASRTRSSSPGHRCP